MRNRSPYKLLLVAGKCKRILQIIINLGALSKMPLFLSSKPTLHRVPATLTTFKMKSQVRMHDPLQALSPKEYHFSLPRRLIIISSFKAPDPNLFVGCPLCRKFYEIERKWNRPQHYLRVRKPIIKVGLSTSETLSCFEDGRFSLPPTFVTLGSHRRLHRPIAQN
jgi:hypothetical protein